MAAGRADANRSTLIGRRMRQFLVAAAVATVAAGGLASTATAQEAPGTVRVVHGLRGLVADIYVDGALALPTFQPERSTDPLPLAAGDHVVEIRTGGAAMTETPLLTQTVTVPSGFQGSLVAHLDPTGAPKLTAFADDLAAVPAGQARVTVRHAAAAEDVSILLNDVPSPAPIAAGTEAAQVLGAGSYELAVAAASGGSVLAAPQSVEFVDGTANFMYLIGSQAEGTLGWAVVRVDGLQSAPARIQTGDGSTGGDATSTLFVLLVGTIAIGLAAGGTLGVRRAHTRRDTASVR